jgi:hypothetical protein
MLSDNMLQQVPLRTENVQMLHKNVSQIKNEWMKLG